MPNLPATLGDIAASASTYDQWAALVKQQGGVATNFPFRGPYYGQPAAKYDVSTYSDLYARGQIGWPDGQTADKRYSYILAPSAVRGDAANLVVPKASELPPSPAFDFTLGGLIPKPVVYAAGALLALMLLSTARSFLPRANPPRRARRRKHAKRSRRRK